jgi:hypothetical protein
MCWLRHPIRHQSLCPQGVLLQKVQTAPQEVKQKGEQACSLAAQVDNRAREAQRAEKSAREAQAEMLRLARDLEDVKSRSQVRSGV